MTDSHTSKAALVGDLRSEYYRLREIFEQGQTEAGEKLSKEQRLQLAKELAPYIYNLRRMMSDAELVRETELPDGQSPEWLAQAMKDIEEVGFPVHNYPEAISELARTGILDDNCALELRNKYRMAIRQKSSILKGQPAIINFFSLFIIAWIVHEVTGIVFSGGDQEAFLWGHILIFFNLILSFPLSFVFFKICISDKDYNGLGKDAASVSYYIFLSFLPLSYLGLLIINANNTLNLVLLFNLPPFVGLVSYYILTRLRDQH